MKSSSFRFAVIGGVAAVAAAALSACSPPHQVDSDTRVDTATRFTAAPSHPGSSTPVTSTLNDAAAPEGELPGIIDCVGTPTMKPDQLSLACGDNNDRLVGITWTSWTAQEAVGTATRETNTCLPNCADGEIENIPNVAVRLENPVAAPQGMTFTQLNVNGEIIPR